MSELGAVEVFIQRNHIHQKVKNLHFPNHLLNVSPLEGFATSLFRMERSSVGQLRNKHLAREGEQDWRFARDHPYIFITLHDFLDSGQG